MKKNFFQTGFTGFLGKLERIVRVRERKVPLSNSNSRLQLLILLILLILSKSTVAAPLQWVCDWPEAKAQTFSLYQGETATFEPTFRVNGQVVSNATIAAVWYQTNGMGNAYWRLDNATFAPSNDVGAASYRFFVEATPQNSNAKLYRANGTLRMLPSPGFVPNVLPLPTQTLDFANVEVSNAPWLLPGDIAPVRAVAAAAAITNAAQDASIGAIVARLDNENARFVSTNYNSQTKINSAFLEVSLRNEQTGLNEWVRVWDQLAIWNRWLGGESLDGWSGFYAWRTNIEAEINSKADRAWGFYDSTTGEWSPDGFTQISSPSILVASGMSYQRTVTSGGEVWVLKSNGMTIQTVGNTNGFFSVSDSDGNTFLEIVRGDRRIVAADASGDAVLTAYDPQALQIDYSIVSDAHPDLRICLDLNNPDWQDEGAANCPATVSWSGHSGAWRAIVQPKSATSRLFVSATYGIGGEARVRILGNDVVPPDYSTGNAQLTATVTATMSETVASLKSSISREAQNSTNYTDRAIADADTSYFRVGQVTNINQSVAYVTNAPSGTLSVSIPADGETKDWIVYAYFGAETLLSLPAAIWWMADEAYTNAIPSNTPTALYFSQVADGIYTLSRQELKSVQVSNP